jgi:amino acid adenylation domain-containing protein
VNRTDSVDRSKSFQHAEEAAHAFWLGTEPPETRPQMIHEIFEMRATQCAEDVAIVFGEKRMTYGKLLESASDIARALVSLELSPEDRVGLYVERNIEMVVCLIGILMSGAAYLPLDPLQPAARLRYIVSDANPKLILYQISLKSEWLPEAAVSIDDLLNSGKKCSTVSLKTTDLDLRPENLAYITYTSGSTGQPKAVLTEHRNLLRLFKETNVWFGFGRQDVWTLFHSMAFDFSVWELWGALLFGGRVVIVPYETSRSPREFYHLICAEGVTVLNQTPSAFLQLTDAQAKSTERHLLRYVIFSGEALKPYMLRPWARRNDVSITQLVDMYGITETTVHVTYRPISGEDIESSEGSLLGIPIPDLQVYVLDGSLRSVPTGAVGEVYVGGAGVSRGYLKRGELTAHRFVCAPFLSESTLRLYRTGDLARPRADGAIEYLGRDDHQVKVRGHRIELMEVESNIALHERVKKVAVLALNDKTGDLRLVAYIVESAGAEITSAKASSSLAREIRDYLKARIPEYMIPSDLRILDEMPLTVNGKIDRQALSTRGHAQPIRGESGNRLSELEAMIGNLWARALGVTEVNPTDDFFELGGDSVIAMRLVSKLESSLGIEIPFSMVHKNPTVRSLGNAIHGKWPEATRRILAEDR